MVDTKNILLLEDSQIENQEIVLKKIELILRMKHLKEKLENNITYVISAIRRFSSNQKMNHC